MSVGTLKVKSTLPDSYITVLVNGITRKAKHDVDPVGQTFLIEQLSKAELLRGLVANAEILRELSQKKRNLLLYGNLRLKHHGSIVEDF